MWLSRKHNQKKRKDESFDLIPQRIVFVIDCIERRWESVFLYERPDFFRGAQLFWKSFQICVCVCVCWFYNRKWVRLILLLLYVFISGVVSCYCEMSAVPANATWNMSLLLQNGGCYERWSWVIMTKSLNKKWIFKFGRWVYFQYG